MHEQLILNACSISGDGSCQRLEGALISERVKDTSLAWVHLNANHPESHQWIVNHVPYLDNIIINALLAEETRPRLLEFADGCLLILRGVNLNDESRPEDMISIRLWVDEHRIISLERRPLKAIKDIRSRLESGRGPKNTGDFVCLLASRLLERMEPIFTALYEDLDDLEEQIMESPDTKDRQSVTLIRKQAIMFRRYIAPQKEVVSHLKNAEQPWLDKTHKRQLQESTDRVVRYVEDMDAVRERSQIIKDELSTALSDKMNKNMYVLSIVAAIFLPLGFLTGLLGINVGGMPGADNPMAFYWVCFACIAFSVIIIWVFKRLRWV